MGMMRSNFAGSSRQASVSEWPVWGAPDRVSIELDTDCLKRLLRSRQLHVENFACADSVSKECVRQLLLRVLSG